MLIIASEEHHDIGYPTIVQTMASLYLGASDTLTTTLQWMTLNLARNPDTQQQCFEEIARSLDKHGKIKPKECHLLQSFLLENMRMFPVSDTLPHYTDEDLTAGGYHIPSGSIIQGSLTAIMHNPAHFEDPNVFKPDRFLVNGVYEYDMHVCNFSVGLRNCIGRQLAQNQYFQYTAQLITRFRMHAEIIDVVPIGRVRMMFLMLIKRDMF